MLSRRSFLSFSFSFFFFNDTATTEIYTLSLHDALPIYHLSYNSDARAHLTEAPLNLGEPARQGPELPRLGRSDRKSTRLNSSHEWISYAVFCLKKKNKANK